MEGSISRVRVWTTLIALAIAWVPGVAFALQPPRPGELKKYAKDGTLQSRIKNGLQLQNHRTHPRLVQNQYRRQNGNRDKMAAGADAAMVASEAAVTGNLLANAPDLGIVPPWHGGLQAIGNPNVFVLLIEFPDALHDDSLNSQASVENKFFGDGDPLQVPYESVKKYYQRSSYGKLNIQGTVFAWYTANHGRSHYEALGEGFGQEELILEALNHFDSQVPGHDFSQYDNDGDGLIDGFYVKWTGSDTGYGSFWWSDTKVWEKNPSYAIDNKALGFYVWSPIASDISQSFSPRVDLHETGHLLGLPDLFDLDMLTNPDGPRTGPDGGVGGLDMMDRNWGDHNCFSKYLLGWVTPKEAISGSDPKSLNVTLNPSGTSEDCVLMVSSGDPGTKFGEIFMAQYRKPLAGTNDAPGDFPGVGLLIWHIDSTLQAGVNKFAYNNTNTAHKYLRLMQADGLEQIEFNGSADAGDFYKAQDAFNAHTKPNNLDYGNELSSGVTVDEIGPAGETLTARFGVLLKPEIIYRRDNQTNDLVWESCPTTKGYMDPFEHVKLTITLQNIGARPATSLEAKLWPNGENWSYGTLNPYARASRAYQFTVSGTCGDTLTVQLALKDGPAALGFVASNYGLGKPIQIFQEGFDHFSDQLPACWTASLSEVPPGVSDVQRWRVINGTGAGTQKSVFAAAPTCVSDNRLISPVIHINTQDAILRFEHSFALEKLAVGYDGGVLEIKIGQEDFVDIFDAGGAFREGSYTGAIVDSGRGNPILDGRPERWAWTGNSGGFISTVVSLPTQAAGQDVQFRWRLGTDDELSVSQGGWYVDSIIVYDGNNCCTRVPGDFDGDGDVDQTDFGYLQRCFTGQGIMLTDPACKEGTPIVRSIDNEKDMEDIDPDDVRIMLGCWSGPNVDAILGCWP